MGMLLTVIIPCYNSSKMIERVVSEIEYEIQKRPENRYQIILINDNSKDNTFQVISNMAKADLHITAVDLSKNFGQANAKMAALAFIEGDIAVCMDDDGQHPPDKIYDLVDKISEGYDLVYAHFSRKKQPVFRRLSSAVNTKLLEMTGAKKKGVYNSPFLAWSSFAIDALRHYHSPFVSAGAYLMRCTDKVINVEVEQRCRASGRSGYNLKKLMNMWLTEFTNFSLVPLRMASILGLFSSFGGMILGLAVVIRKLIHPSISAGYTSFMAVQLLIGGIVMLMLGLVGEYIGKIYMLISGQPQYFIRTVVRQKEEEENE